MPGPGERQRLVDGLIADAQAGRRIYRRSQIEMLSGALASGRALAELRGIAQHGEWSHWLAAIGIERMTAWNWMRLVELGLDAQQIVEAGGIAAAIRAHRDDSLPCGHARILRAPSGVCGQCVAEGNATAGVPPYPDVVINVLAAR